MNQVKKKLGFGCMRLPMKADGRVDTAEFSRMVLMLILSLSLA